MSSHNTVLILDYGSQLTQLIARRDRFENLFRDLVGALPLPREMDRSVYRNLLLSQLNSAADWYRPGRLSPEDIGEQVALLFRK